MIESQTEIADPTVNVLEEGLTHKVILLFLLPERLPTWIVAIMGAVFAALAGLVWWIPTSDRQLAGTVALTLALFMVMDGSLLIYFPRNQISFGPWKAQFAALALPRMLAATAVAFLSRWLGEQISFTLFVIIQSMGTAALIWGGIYEPFRLGLSELVLFTDRLPVGVPPIRILHISDIHLERLTKREDDLLKIVKKAKPDLIILTGDYVNISYTQDAKTLVQVQQLLRQLWAPYGVYGTLGSPSADNRQTVLPALQEVVSIHWLRQESQEVDLGDGRRIALLGLDCTHHLPTDQARLAQVMQTAPRQLPQILCYHSPELMPQAAGYGLDLYLCGHTHGGQVRLPLIGPLLTSSQLGRRYVMGHYRDGRTHLYVSRGVGLEGLSAPRVRFLCPPEITLITLIPNG